LVGLVTTLFHTLTYQRKTVIMLHLATHTNDVPVFSSPAFSTPANLVPRFPVPRFQSPRLWPIASLHPTCDCRYRRPIGLHDTCSKLDWAVFYVPANTV